jgi:hypothetical protein
MLYSMDVWVHVKNGINWMEPIEIFKHRGMLGGFRASWNQHFFHFEDSISDIPQFFLNLNFLKIMQKYSKCLNGYMLKGPTPQMLGPHHVIRYSNIFFVLGAQFQWTSNPNVLN